MKTIFDNRLFCLGMSLACAWFMYQDFQEHAKINIVNVMYFACFTFLALYRKKNKNEDNKQPINNEYKNITIKNNKKDIIPELTEDKELQLTKTFQK